MRALEEQIDRYVELEVHHLAGMTERQFRTVAGGLAGGGAAGGGVASAGADPLLIIHPDLIPAARLAPLLEREGKPGFVVEDLTDLADFTPIDVIEVPAAPFYLLNDMQRGDELRNLSPAEALPHILRNGRTPLTISEGISWLLQEPERLEPDHCFMCIASRKPKARGGLDSRTPALWISGGTGRDGKERKGAPKVGWCWANNRHTWLGFGSAAWRSAGVGATDGSGHLPWSPW